MKSLLKVYVLILMTSNIFAQDTICVNNAILHEINSEELGETREYWVSLPLQYSDKLSYPVIYVLDAEWRFDLTRHIVFDQGANKIIEKSIIVGIPHIDVETKRGIDLTFSESKVEYDGDKVDANWYNSSNSGGGLKFYNYFVKELIPDVNKHYATNGHETLIGHSYGGYFGGYILGFDHPFEVIHLYDPSIWYSNGEVVERLREKSDLKNKTIVHLTYQPEPVFHKEKIEALIRVLRKKKNFKLTTKFYKDYTHNALFLDSFYNGIRLTNKVEKSNH